MIWVKTLIHATHAAVKTNFGTTRLAAVIAKEAVVLKGKF